MPSYTHASDTGAYTLTGATATLAANPANASATGAYRFTTSVITFNVLLRETCRFTSPVIPVLVVPRTTVETVGLQPQDSPVWGFGRQIADILQLYSPPSDTFKFRGNLTASIAVHESLLTTLLASLTERVGFGETSKQAIALFILDALSITSSTAAQMIYNLSVLELVQFRSSLGQFLSGEITDSLVMSSTTIPKYAGNVVLGDGLGLQDILGNSLVFRVVSKESAAFGESSILKQILRNTLTDIIQLSAAHVSPDGTFTTWAVNTRTGATTEYTNWQFNSFAEINGRYIGANATGLYELNGPDDFGTSIIADIKSGRMQLGGSRFTAFKAAYLGVRGGSATLDPGDAGPFYLKLETGDGKFFTYKIDARDMKTTKVNLGKGLRARYFSYQLTSTGQDFDLDSIEFLPIVEQRRV